MALMKWGKYNVETSSYYTNESIVQQYLGRYPLTSPFVQGYDSYGFDSYSGFYDVGNYGDQFAIAFSSYSTSVYMSSLVEVGGEYFYDEYLYATCDEITNNSKGSFIEEVIAESGTYPADGESGAYWYVLIGAAFFTIKCEIDSVLKTGVDGWCKIDGTLKKIAGGWIKVDGVLKQLK